MDCVERYFQGVRDAKRRAQVRYALRHAAVRFSNLQPGDRQYNEYPYKFGYPLTRPI